MNEASDREMASPHEEDEKDEEEDFVVMQVIKRRSQTLLPGTGQESANKLLAEAHRFVNGLRSSIQRKEESIDMLIEETRTPTTQVAEYNEHIKRLRDEYARLSRQTDRWGGSSTFGSQRSHLIAAITTLELLIEERTSTLDKLWADIAKLRKETARNTSNLGFYTQDIIEYEADPTDPDLAERLEDLVGDVIDLRSDDGVLSVDE